MANLHASWDSCFSLFLTDQGGRGGRREGQGRAGGGAAQGDLCGALLALPVLLGQVNALQTLLLPLRLLLLLLLVVTFIASNDLGRCAPAAVLRGRLRLSAGIHPSISDGEYCVVCLRR